MSDLVTDAGKMVCPKCGAGLHRNGPGRIRNEFACRSVEWDDGYFSESFQCVTNQRDQLRARVEELEAYAGRLEDVVSILSAFGNQLEGELYTPTKTCSCHIKPNCNDCQDWNHLRAIKADWVAGIKRAAAAKETKP